MEHSIQNDKFIKMVPIFVCGHGSSGTTLLTALLDGHSSVLVLPEETYYLEKVFNEPNVSLIDAFNWLLAENSRKVKAKKAMTDAEYIDGQDYDYHILSPLIIPNLGHIQADGQLFVMLSGAFAEVTKQLGKKYFVEKTPGNEYFLSLVQKWFDHFKAIYIVRDPRDVYVSYSKKLAKVKKPHSVERFVNRWASSILSWNRLSKSSPNSLTIRYEDLVHHTKPTMDLVCSFLEVTHELILEEPTKLGKPWGGNSLYTQNIMGVNNSAVGRWKNEISEDDLRFLESYLGRIMTDYGYNPIFKETSIWDIIKMQAKRKEKRKETLRIMLYSYLEFNLKKKHERYQSG